MNTINDGVESMEAKQTPLIDLLESVPRDAVLVYEHDQFSSSSPPVGRLCHEAAAELRRLHAEVERLRTDGASAVRWAPGSAYWSDVLRDLFGPDARKGIDVLERRWQAALERADKLAEALEEAARVCEELDEEASLKEGRLASGHECATAIRAMKEQA